MKKKFRIFFFVIYFLFTFILGLLIALVLPNVNLNILQYEKMNEYVETQQFVYAMDLVGGLYNEKAIYHEKYDEDSGLIIFEATSFYLEVIENKETETKTETRYINNSYICFIYGVDGAENFQHETLNVSRVVLNQNEDWAIELDTFYQDLNAYVIETLVNSNYIYFAINEKFCNSKGFSEIGSIKVYDANGNLCKDEVLFDDNLTFESNYFNETDKFVEKYNYFYSNSSNPSNLTEEEKTVELENIFEEIKTKCPDCVRHGTYVYDSIKAEADKESTIFVLIYFIWVYILGDFLVGPRYILRFLTFLFRKIKPKKVKSKEEIVEPTLGFGFISTLNIEVNVPEELQEDIVIEYEHSVNPDYNFKTVITRTVEYKKKERVHGGSYKLVSATCHGFEVVNLPEKLEVKGYAMKLSFEIKHENN